MAKKLLGALIFSNPSVIATPPQATWNELTVQQKSVLAPLGGDWDAMEHYRRKKWLGIALRFPNMTPDEQQRIQAQMQEWTKLTPEQRQLARQKFQTVNKLPTEKKQELKQKWEEYSNLPEEEKEKHKQQAASKPLAKPGRPAAAGVPPAVPPASATPPVTATAPGAGVTPAAPQADAAADTPPRP